MVLDALNARSVLGGDNERPPFSLGEIGGPQMDNAVLDGHICRRDLGPFLRLQRGQ